MKGNGGWVALSFDRFEDIRKCLEIIYERGDIPFELPGEIDVIVSRAHLDFLKEKLLEEDVRFDELEVISMGDLSPAEANRLRREQRFTEIPH